jgi:hypothetical protein
MQDNATTIDSPTLFATCGWQFSDISSRDEKIVKGYGYEGPVPGKCVLWSTDGGSYAKNPRRYSVKGVLDKDRALNFNSLLSLLDHYSVELGFDDMDMAVYGGKYTSESSKCTISKKESGYVLTHYFTRLYDYETPLEAKIVYAIDKTLNISNIEVAGEHLPEFAPEDIPEFIQKNSTSLQSRITRAILSWEVLSDMYGMEFPYLEIVRSACEYYLSGKPVREAGIRYMDDESACKSYTAVANIRPDRGFCMDESAELKGRIALCVICNN